MPSMNDDAQSFFPLPDLALDQHAVRAFAPGEVPAPRALDERDRLCMGLALQAARAAADRGEVPIGAVVCHEPIDPATRRPLAEPSLLAIAGNRREELRDPSGHAEFIALREASRALDVWRLTGCTVYVTLEPCIMCAGLMHQARIDRCVFGAFDPKAGALGSLYSINDDARLNHAFPVSGGVREAECAQLLKDFFGRRRRKR